MQSTFFISSNNTRPEDSGVYTCRVILIVDTVDAFNDSATSLVTITGKHIISLVCGHSICCILYDLTILYTHHNEHIKQHTS